MFLLKTICGIVEVVELINLWFLRCLQSIETSAFVSILYK
jgi:hypothetical protein